MNENEMEIRKIKADRMNPAPYNPREKLAPDDPRYQKLEKSLEEFGNVLPIVWNQRTGNIVGGHVRYDIETAQGKTELEVSVVDLSEIEEKALNLALNKSFGDWDRDRLNEILDEITESSDIDLLCTGFDASVLDEITSAAEEVTASPQRFENNEISQDNFASGSYDHTCPRCGFEYDD